MLAIGDGTLLVILSSPVGSCPMLVSAVVCTHNRLEHLRRAIESLTAQSLDPAQFEILLVDNASSDGTAAWAASFGQAVKNLIYSYEPRLGLNNARNTGWRQARANIVAFLDDDAVADVHWLKNIVEKFSQLDDRAAAIGGKVDPLWEAPPPPWLEPRFWPPLCVLDLSDNDMRMERNHYFVGANMAIRTEALAKVGGFHPLLDRQGKNLLSNGELHLKRLLEAAGYHSYFCPEIKVQHLVPKDRMTEAWFRKRYFWQGISDERLFNSINPRSRGARSWVRTCLRTSRDSMRFVGGCLRERALACFRSRTVQSKLDEQYRRGVLAEKWTGLMH